MARENVFMKNNISRGKELFGLKVIDSISLLSTWVPKKNATMCSFVKLMFWGKVGGIT